MVCFDGDDAGYLDWLARNPYGYVVNVRRRLDPEYVVLHRATCGSISATLVAGAYTERDYVKLCGRSFADVCQAPTYCGRAKGSFTKRCSHCNPRS